MSDKNTKFSLNVFKRVTRLAAQKKGLFFFSLVVAVFLACIAAFRPILVGDAVDQSILNKDSKALLDVLLIIALLLFGEVLLQFFQIFFANLLAQNVIKTMRDNLYKKLVNFRLAFFDRTPNGVLVTRSVSDIETVAEVLNDGILVFMGDFTRIIFVTTFMFSENWKLSIIVLLILPLMVIVTRYFQKALKEVFQLERTLTARLNAFVQERLSGMNVVQLFNREESEYFKFRQINGELKEAYVKTIFYFALLFPVVDLVSSLAIAALVVGGGVSAIYFEDVSPGQIFTFVMFIQMLVRPIRQIAERFNSIQRGLIGAERVFKLIDSDETIPDKGQVSNHEFRGDISFEKVRFSYDEKEEVLRGVSFEAQKGETIAIVGATGAGKSTIINLLNRFYDIESGEIKIDGRLLEDYSLKSLRDNIGTVTQDVFLFNSSIYENIVMGKKDILPEDVESAAKQIGIHNFIMSLPMGYQHQVSERGGDLSSGQRQLISFLRAYIYNPTILVLDEATSSIDTLSEELIQIATEKLTQGRTSIVVAHRLATIQKADKIIVMEKGKIAEIGNHETLLKKKGIYSNLYEAQFKNHAK